MDDALPYLMRGLRHVSTDSSVLVSSSKYLNNPKLRDWVATNMLRRSGKDRPPTADTYELHLIMKEIQDRDHVDALFEQERQRNPQLDAWLSERFMSNLTAQDVKACAPDTLGGTFHREVIEKGYSIEIMPPLPEPPKSHLDYYMMRNGQTHDFEHILTGGGLDFIGELVPYYARLVNVFKHLSPELAGELSVFNILGAMRIMSRGMLHYPQTWPAIVDAMERGIAVGRASDPIFMLKCEDALHLPLDVARERLGIRDARFVDTSAETAIYLEQV